MLRKFLVRPAVVPVIVGIQFVPLLLFPTSSYSPSSQEWWLPVLLSSMVLVAILQLFIRRSPAMWPWHLLSFAQGFNIISRLMMLMPHAMVVTDQQERFNTGYVLLTILAMLGSAFMIGYCELPEVRNSIFAKGRGHGEKVIIS